MSLCGSDFVKDILQDSGNLKRVAWGLDVGTRHGQTSIKTEFAFPLPSNFFYLLFFIFFFKEVCFLIVLRVTHNKGCIVNQKERKILIG